MSFSLALTLACLSLLDTAATLLLVAAGAAEEGNPVMGAALGASPVLFVALKLGVTLVGLVGLTLTESVRALGALVGVYLGVCILHGVLLITWLS